MTEQEITQLADAIVARQEEYDAYTKNIATYTAIVDKLDGNWDAHLLKFKGIDPHTAAADCPLEDIERLAELQYFDNCSRLLRTETVERFKSRSILEHLDSLLAGANRDQALADAVARRNALKNAAPIGE